MTSKFNLRHIALLRLIGSLLSIGSEVWLASLATTFLPLLFGFFGCFLSFKTVFFNVTVRTTEEARFGGGSNGGRGCGDILSKALTFLILEGRLEFIEVERIKEEQGRCKIVILGRKGTNKRHTEEFLIKCVESEGGRTKCPYILQCFISACHQLRQGFVIVLSNIEESVMLSCDKPLCYIFKDLVNFEDCG
jgi:hypothetical protein